MGPRLRTAPENDPLAAEVDATHLSSCGGSPSRRRIASTAIRAFGGLFLLTVAEIRHVQLQYSTGVSAPFPCPLFDAAPLLSLVESAVDSLLCLFLALFLRFKSGRPRIKIAL